MAVHYSRRRFLGTTVGLLVGSILTACGPAPAPTPTATLAPAKPAVTPTPPPAPVATPTPMTAPVSKPLSQRRKVTLEFWNWWGVQRKPLMDEILAQFSQTYPWITVNNVVQPWDRRAEKVLTALASGNPPQVIMATREEIVRFAAEGLIIPITKYVKSRNLNVNEMFYQSEIESMWWKGELYSTPMPTAGGETGLMFIHKPLLQQAGLDPAKPPKTWQELEQAARTTTKRSPAKGIEVMGADVGTNGTAFIAWLYTNNGAFLSDDLRKITFHSEEGVQTLEWMLKFTNEINGGVENVNDFWQAATGEAGQFPFYQNRLAFWFTNVSAFFHIKNFAPNLQWGLTLRPYNGANPKAGSHGVAALAFGWGYVIPKGLDSDTEEAAYLLVEWITTTEQGACRFMFEQMRPSPLKKCNENPKYKEINPYWDVVKESLARDIPVKITPVQSQLYQALNQQVQEAFFRRKTAKEALAQAAEQAQRVLDEWWSKQR